MNRFAALFMREVRRVVRQPARVVAAIATPLLLMVVLGSGLGNVVSSGDSGFTAFLVPGSVVLVVLFAGVFNAIALIEDRDRGLLRGLLAGPTRMSTFVLSRLASGGLLAFVQGAVVLAALPVVGEAPSVARLAIALPTLALASVAVQAACLTAGWLTGSTAGFHAVMNTVLMPAWLLGGAFFPVDGAAAWVRWGAVFNPAAWIVDLVRLSLTGESRVAQPGVVWGVGVSVCVGFVLAAFASIRRTHQ